MKTITSYDKWAFARAKLVGWPYYARVYANMVKRSGVNNGHVFPDATQSTKMCLWHSILNKE